MSAFNQQGGAKDIPQPPGEHPRAEFQFQVGDVVKTDDRGNQGVVIAVDLPRVQVRLIDRYTGHASEQYFAPYTLTLIKRSANTRRLKLLSYAELQAMTPSGWLIPGVLREGELAGLYGPSGEGKTFIAIDIALSVAVGESWAGRACVRGPVLYIAAEAVYSIRERSRAWVRQFEDFERCEQDLEGWFEVLGDAVSFVETEFEALMLLVKGRAYSLIIVDTLARCMAGGDENNAKDMGLFVRGCDRLRKETGAAVLVIHHSGKGGAKAERGSSAFRGACDSMFTSKEARQRVFRMGCDKQKEGEEFGDMEFELRIVEVGKDEYGAPRTSGRLKYLGAATQNVEGAKGRDGQRDADEVIQMTLAESFFEDGASDSELKAAIELPKSTYHRHLKLLADGGVIARTKLGRSSRYTLTPKSAFYKPQSAPAPAAAERAGPSPSPAESHGTHETQQDPTTAQSQSQSPSPPLGGDGGGTETDGGPAKAKKAKKPGQKKAGGA